MRKLARSGAALLLGLFMAMTLILPGAFAQRVDTHHTSATPSANRVVVSAVLTGARTAAQQQIVQPLSMHHAGWGGGGWWGGGWGNGWWGWDNGWGGWWGGCGC